MKHNFSHIHLIILVRLWRNFSFWPDGIRIITFSFAKGTPLEVCKWFFVLISSDCNFSFWPDGIRPGLQEGS